VMARIWLAACAGGRARRRRVLQLAHGGRVQLNSTGSFTGGQGCCRRKESRSGLLCSSVYVRRRPIEVRRCQSGVFGEVVFGLRARCASLSSREASQGVGRGGRGLEWPVYGGRGSGCRWHAVRRANTGELVLGQGWERAGVYGRGRGWLYSH
jgi:surface antigen